MGDTFSRSSRQQRAPPQRSTPQSAPPASAAANTTTTTASSSTPAAKPAPFVQADIVVSATPSDGALVNALKIKMEAESYKVFNNTSTSDEAAKEVARMLVDATLLIFVLSEESVSNSKCGDQVSLAYISNKPILLVARKSKEELTKKLNFGLKLTLEQLTWLVCEPEQPSDDFVSEFIKQVHQFQNPVSESAEGRATRSLEAAAPVSLKQARLNTKLSKFRAQSTMELEEVSNTFWDRNFDSDKVQWFRFQQCFIAEYDTKLKNLFTDQHIPWLLDEVLHKGIFGGADEVTKEHFMLIRGDSKEKHTFWHTVRQIAVEKFNMREVFNMQSTVRLTAVENLGKFQNMAVIEALLRLLEDPDPNIRAVAAISLGRTGVQEDNVIESLISLLKDSDRIVRQSACLSLGTLKSTKAIPHISHIWRNDFISVVRDAARTALEKMDVPEAQEVLKVTRVLEEEIKQLEGKIVSV